MTRTWLIAVAAVALNACAGSPIDRAAGIETTACGHASGTSGAGVIVGDEQVLVAAHVVIGATEVFVSWTDGKTASGKIVRLDTRTDLAIVEVAGVRAERVELATAHVGDVLTMVGGGPSAPFKTKVSRKVEIRIEEVRSDVRSSRSGYEIEDRVQLGDSGAGVFNAEGALVGVVFGRPQADLDRSFVVDAEEVDDILNRQVDTIFKCDPSQHQVIWE